MKQQLATRVFPTIFLTILLSLSCTKLDVPVYDKLAEFWRNDAEIDAGVGAVYAGLRGYGIGFGGLYSLNEMSTDEVICPIRGTDWVDDMVWDNLWKHSWTPEHFFVDEGWHFIYGGIAQVNFALEHLKSPPLSSNQLASLVAELKTIRAFYYFHALDLFGDVPVSTSTHDAASSLSNVQRAKVFEFVEKEIRNQLPQLTANVNKATYGKCTKWFAQAILAKLYLNAEVYTGSPRWNECVSACDAILTANLYALESNFFDNFKIANENSQETIFAIPYDRVAGLDPFAVQLFTLHYNSPATFGLQMAIGVNGYCSTDNYLQLFDLLDKRRKMFLIGQQYEGGDSSKPQKDRLGNLLIFDPHISSFVVQDPYIETAGARCAKWEFNKEGMGNMSNDFAIFRLADIILMKAEAQFRMGKQQDALNTINHKINGVSIRSRAGLHDVNSTEMNPDGLLRERACEFSWEGWRRNDMIRLGHFTDARVPDKLVSGNYRKLFPIPQSELEKNSYLRQNPGY